MSLTNSIFIVKIENMPNTAKAMSTIPMTAGCLTANLDSFKSEPLYNLDKLS